MECRVRERGSKKAVIYKDVEVVRDYWTKGEGDLPVGTYCYRLTMMNGETATYPKSDWVVEKMDWVEV